MRFLARESVWKLRSWEGREWMGEHSFFSFFGLVVGVNHTSRKVARVYVCVCDLHTFFYYICEVCVCVFMRVLRMCFLSLSLCMFFSLSFI